jgi:hypothetical protein
MMDGQGTRRAFIAQSAAALALSRSAFAGTAAEDHGAGSVPQPLGFGSISAGGDLGHRTAQNFARLQADIYRPPAMWRQTNWKSWPGDLEGRALLAVTLLARATGQEPDYFSAMVAAYPAQLNAQGYFGPLLDLHAINEQQLSGHGWFLRGLCELYEYQRADAGAVKTQSAEQTLAMIRAVVKNLALPLRGSYATYPIDPALRKQTAGGGVDGHLSGEQSNWAISTDTGCAFIFLDGMAHAWVVLKAAGAPEAAPLKALVDEATARFLQVDLVAIQAQTHASLTAMRALLRVYAETGDAALLGVAEERYRLYRMTAMTEHYANTNWFGRPETWTEPCAIIDSFMVATQLWQHTGKAAYLEDAHLIWFNGVGRGLRANGGFGTDTCVGAKSAMLKVRSYEAYFCCTMRGGEGHARAAQYLYFTRPGELMVAFYSNSEATVDLGHGPMKLRQKTNYPYAGSHRIEVVSAPAAGAMTLRLFAPRWTTKQTLTLNDKPVATTLRNGFLTAVVRPKAGDVIYLQQEMRVGAREPISSATQRGAYVFEAGPLVLGYQSPVVANEADAPVAADPAAAPARRAPAPDPPEVRIPRDAKLVYAAGVYMVRGMELSLARINDLNDSKAGPRDPCTRQILFREG